MSVPNIHADNPIFKFKNWSPPVYSLAGILLSHWLRVQLFWSAIGQPLSELRGETPTKVNSGKRGERARWETKRAIYSPVNLLSPSTLQSPPYLHLLSPLLPSTLSLNPFVEKQHRLLRY